MSEGRTNEWVLPAMIRRAVVVPATRAMSRDHKRSPPPAGLVGKRPAGSSEKKTSSSVFSACCAGRSVFGPDYAASCCHCGAVVWRFFRARKQGAAGNNADAAYFMGTRSVHSLVISKRFISVARIICITKRRGIPITTPRSDVSRFSR